MADDRSAHPLERNVARVRELIEAGRINELAKLSKLSPPTLRTFALGGRCTIMTAVDVQVALEQLDEQAGRSDG